MAPVLFISLCQCLATIASAQVIDATARHTLSLVSVDEGVTLWTRIFLVFALLSMLTMLSL